MTSVCYFITVGVRHTEAESLERAISRGLAVDLVDNNSVRAHLPGDYRTYLLTSGM